MEVHHHSAHREKKNWKSYAGEFLMLFLAVFCGFLAESYRETSVEKEKAHEYMTSMVSDLEKDTFRLQEYIDVNKKITKRIDSLLIYLKIPGADATKKVYINSSAVGASALFERESGTITQLKNAGGLRLIKDTACVNVITEYDQFNEHVKKQGDAYYSSMIDILGLMEQIMDFSLAALKTPPPVYFLSPDKDKMRLFYNKCYIQKKIIDNYCYSLSEQKKVAVKGIALLRKKYHLS